MAPTTQRRNKLALYVYLLVAAYGVVLTLCQPVKVELGVSQLSAKHVNDLLVAHYGSKLHAVQWQTDPAVQGCNRLSFRATETILDRPTLVRRFSDSMNAAGGVACGSGLSVQTLPPAVLGWLPLLALGLFWLITFVLPVLLNQGVSAPPGQLQSLLVSYASRCCLALSLAVLVVMMGRLAWLFSSAG